jgi:hypothetical protein
LRAAEPRSNRVAAAPSGGGAAAPDPIASGAARPRDDAPSAEPPSRPAAQPPHDRRSQPHAQPVAITAAPFTLEGVLGVWPELVDAVRERSRWLGEALAGASPREVAPPKLIIMLEQPNPLFADRLEQQAAIVEAAVAARVGAPVRLQITAPADPAASRPPRISDAGKRADRLEGLRRRDPSLDVAADELDLEIVD